MAPRKTADKPRIEVQHLKPKKGVRKKLSIPKFPKSVTGRRSKIPPTEDLPVTEESHNLKNMPVKNRRTKAADKQNRNEKNVEHEDVVEPYIPEDVRPKNKARAAGKRNQNETKIEHFDGDFVEPYIPEDVRPKNKAKIANKSKHDDSCVEVTEELHKTEEVVPKNKKTKAASKQSHVHVDKATDEAVKPKYVPTKIRNTKTTRVNNQSQYKIEITLVDEAVDSPHDLEEVLPKAKKLKPLQRQNQKKKISKEAIADEVGDSPDDVPPKHKKAKAACKQNNNEIKIMLANEVVRSAFQKKTNIVNNLPRPARRKRNICKSVEYVKDTNIEPEKVLDGDELIEDVAKKKPVKYVYSRKRVILEDAPPQLPIVTSQSPLTKDIPKKRRTLSLRRNILKPINEQTSQNTGEVKEGKEETQESVLIHCNEISLNSKEPTAPDSTSKNNIETQSQKPSNINCRKNSGNSTSTCLSWTKDISSSSTTTCITVKSDDFVRIDNKLPVIKLNNINRSIKRKHSIDNISDDNSFDSHQEILKCPSECSNDSITNLNVSQTLNLSTSSLTSVNDKFEQNNCNSKENKDDRVTKLRQSLENLSCKMKNFDLEMINWIGYESVSKDVNNENFHARIFEVLNYENEVIRYCREIKRVLVGDQQSTKVIEKCPNDKEVACLEPKTVNNLTEINRSKDVTDCSDKLNRDIFDNKSESRIEKDTKITPDRDGMLNERESLGKNVDVQDNDDDDALSLFAESITGLESSRKNSHFASSVFNDKSVTRPHLSEPLRKNRIMYQPTSIMEKDKEPVSYQIINSVKKQTADSSTIINSPKDNNKLNIFQTNNNRTATVPNQFNDRSKVHNVGVTQHKFNNINGVTANNKFNTNLFSNTVQLPDTLSRSPNDISENSNNRSSEFQNYTATCLPNSYENNTFNVSQDISALSINASENWNDMTQDIQRHTNRESVSEAENSIVRFPDVDLKQSMTDLETTNKQIHVEASSIFKGVCIFNLVSNCKNMICSFPHKNIDVDFVTSKLEGMNEEMFIKESMYLLKWPVLRRKYGMCFVGECIRRNLTVWVLHLVRDFIAKMNRQSLNKEAFVVEIIEATLLHLNEADMLLCADILRSKIRPNICLCDHLMKVISETQNFSRFKKVFIKLTLFMCQNGRSFRLDVATQVLERLCILPYDDALARSLMMIIMKTNPSIFTVPMMGFLEKQLSKNNMELYNELMSLKQQAERYSQNLASPPTQSPRIASSDVGHQPSTTIVRADSPDTTNVDFVNKPAEPVITRTITINRTIDTSNLNTSAGSESFEEPMKRYQPQKPETTWRKYSPNLMAMRPQRQVYKRLGPAPRAFNGTPPVHFRPGISAKNRQNNKYRGRPPQHPY